jgi:hypothetical protein
VAILSRPETLLRACCSTRNGDATTFEVWCEGLLQNRGLSVVEVRYFEANLMVSRSS